MEHGVTPPHRHPQSMASIMRETLGRIKRAIWRQEQSIVYSLPPAVGSRATFGHSFVGMNALEDSAHAHAELTLPNPYEEFRVEGDAGLIAIVDGRIAGWLWIRKGPYEELVGCGIAKIPCGTNVIRYFEVLPAMQGMGIGKSLLLEGARRFRSVSSERAIAFVGAKNTASIRAFDAAGFQRETKIAFRQILGSHLHRRIPVSRSGEC